VLHNVLKFFVRSRQVGIRENACSNHKESDSRKKGMKNTRMF
jgi:hypothetical protein